MRPTCPSPPHAAGGPAGVGLWWLLLLFALLAGCGSQPWQGREIAGATFLQRTLTQENGPIRVTAAVPDDAETLVLTGLDLYEQGIQPVWLKVENRGTKPARVALWSIDRDYFSPIEVAYMNRKSFSAGGYAEMERWFHENGLERTVPPGESRSGLVFTHLKPGTKGFNLDVFSNRAAHSFTFFVPLPGFTADYMEVDFANLYDDAEIRQLDEAGLKVLLETEVPCCASGPEAGTDGGPLNVALVGTPLAVRRSLLRGGWNETQAGSEDTLQAREHRFRGQPPHAIFYLDRKDGNERMHIHLWRAPWTIDGEPGWIGQVYYKVFEESLLRDIADKQTLRDSAFLSRFVKESVAADVDSAQRYLLQIFWYNQSLRKFGVVSGVGPSTPDDPRLTFDGVGYFSDGNRFVLFLSETPVPLNGTKILYGGEFLRAGGTN